MKSEMNTINLLPPRIFQELKRRRTHKRCAAAQVLIVLALSALVFLLNHGAYKAWAESDRLSYITHGFSDEPTQAAIELQNALLRQSYRELFLSIHERPGFCPSWLYGLTEAPYEVFPARLDFDGSSILLVCLVQDLRLIETHRQILLELFPQAIIGRIDRSDESEFFTYELRLELW